MIRRWRGQERARRREGWGKKAKTPRTRRCPRVFKFLVLFTHKRKAEKGNVCSDRETDSGKGSVLG